MGKFIRCPKCNEVIDVEAAYSTIINEKISKIHEDMMTHIKHMESSFDKAINAKPKSILLTIWNGLDKIFRKKEQKVRDIIKRDNKDIKNKKSPNNE